MGVLPNHSIMTDVIQGTDVILGILSFHGILLLVKRHNAQQSFYCSNEGMNRMCV